MVKKLTKIATLSIAALLCAAMLAGCLTDRRIIRIDDHPTKQGTVMETQDSYYFVFWFQAVHQFWQCTDTGKTVECTPLCGPTTDLECPAVVGSGNDRFTNAR